MSHLTQGHFVGTKPSPFSTYILCLAAFALQRQSGFDKDHVWPVNPKKFTTETFTGSLPNLALDYELHKQGPCFMKQYKPHA